MLEALAKELEVFSSEIIENNIFSTTRNML